MPCRDYGVDEYYRNQEETVKKKMRPLNNKVQKLTKLLCEASKLIPKDEEKSKELSSWIIKHNKEDALREKKEKLEKEIKLLNKELDSLEK